MLLSTVAEVTILTASRYRSTTSSWWPPGTRGSHPQKFACAFVEEPTAEELGGWYDVTQCYSARVLERLRELYPDGGPDLIEFPDFLAEGFVTVQAAEALDPFLEDTCVCVRIHTSAEITEVLNGYHHAELSRQVLYAMERHALAHADRVIWPLGDVLRDLPSGSMAATALGSAVRIRYPYVGSPVAADADRGLRVGSSAAAAVRGAARAAQGGEQPHRAARGLDRDDFRLVLLGGDTATGSARRVDGRAPAAGGRRRLSIRVARSR